MKLLDLENAIPAYFIDNRVRVACHIVRVMTLKRSPSQHDDSRAFDRCVVSCDKDGALFIKPLGVMYIKNQPTKEK